MPPALSQRLGPTQDSGCLIPLWGLCRRRRRQCGKARWRQTFSLPPPAKLPLAFIMCKSSLIANTAVASSIPTAIDNNVVVREATGMCALIAIAATLANASG